MSNFLGVNFVKADSAISSLLNDYEEESKRIIHFVAVSTFIADNSDYHLIDILNNNYSVCDSRILHLLAHLNGFKIAWIRGTDFLRNYFISDEIPRHHFFLGSSENNLRNLFTNLNSLSGNKNEYSFLTPNIKQVDTEEIRALAKIINESQCDVVWVALGSPKQDYVSQALKDFVNVPIVCIGAAVDILSGNKRESPKFLSFLGLEWLFRFILEPKRLFKRYWIGNFKFLIRYLRWKITGNFYLTSDRNN